ncbi:DUF2336 domain-containing protein [Brevundimonas terrae]|uniref:DUF2336 domain-containing protein n=1 Tax=Brevundimonas terrae TaxID=363631 RepID=A0ABP3I3D2_9CAUL|nr:DUF2336 domain-containing protein [Brevundimonas terrae]NIJ26236.1 uncharacterized protein (DUF2336 family) [Brevundimonas terrae]
MGSAAVTKSAADRAAENDRARLVLLRRLADVVSLPASRINAFERSVVADLMVDMLRQAPLEERRRIAARLVPLTDIPDNICRLLLRDDIVVARELLDEAASLSDHDLISCAASASIDHCKHIARRRGLTPAVCHALIERADAEVTQLVLANKDASIPTTALETTVAQSRQHPELCAVILKRPELRPSSAYVMFWWCNHEERSIILRRFAVSREVLQSTVADLFGKDGGGDDAYVRKALQFIERRQRDRDAAQISHYGGLEGVIQHAAEAGLTPDLVAEIGQLAGVKPLTAAKMLSDEGGESIAVMCKATGLTKQYLALLWKAMRRPFDEKDENGDVRWERVQVVYEILAVDRAQTVLRYWNWALTSALTPQLIRAIREGEEHLVDAFSAAERAAMLALSEDFKS